MSMTYEEWVSCREDLDLAADALPHAWTSLEIGEQLRLLRVSRGISQRHLAQWAELSQAAVSRFEHGGDARLSTLAALCSGLGFGMTFVPTIDVEEMEDFLRSEARDRSDRMERGRQRRR